MKMASTRRAALAVTGIGALGAVFGDRMKAADMSAVEKANLQVVNDFCTSWRTHDSVKIASFFTDSCAYRMIETMEPTKGLDAVTARIASLAPNVQGFEVMDSWARGPMVINERIDRFSSGALKTWHGVGVFFLREGKIVEWYDYTITMERR